MLFDFSVIIATYNREKYLKECLESLVLQRYKNFETIIVDDGSTDNTQGVVDLYKNSLYIKYIKIVNSGYPSIPRNIAAKHADGNWLCFLDSDDKWEEDKLLKCVPHLMNYDVIYHKLKYFGKGTPFYRIALPSRQVKAPVFVDLMTKGNSIPLSGSIVKKQIFIAVKSFDENIALAGLEDYDLWLRISKITDKFKFIPEVLGYYRMHGNSITQFSYKQIEKINFVYQKHLPLLERNYHKQASIIKDYYLGVVFERMKNYQKAIYLYKQSLKSGSRKQILKSLIKIILLSFKQSVS